MENNLWIFLENDWLPAILYKKENNIYHVKPIGYTDIITTDTLYIRNDDNIDNTNNLINIPHLNEPSILNAIYLRYNDIEIKYIYICNNCDTTWKTT